MRKPRHRLVTVAALTIGTTGTLAHAQDQGTQAELDALRARVEALESGSEPTSTGSGDFNVGGTSIDIYGYLKADFYYDTDFRQGDTAFVNAIGEPTNATDGSFGATARQSRLGFRTNTDTSIGNVAGKLELDLFGSGGTAELRLRHASVQLGDNWLIGQDWTNFMPLSQYPTTVEFNGPVGISFARVPQIRYTHNWDQLTFSASIEENNAASDDPTFTSALSYDTDLFSARVAGLTGSVRSGGQDIDQSGFTLSGAVRPWEGGLFQATYVDGEALGPLLIGGGNAAVGGQANDVSGYTLEFRQDIGARWNVGIAYGREDYDLASSTGTLAFDELETIHLNAFYKATDDLTFSAEYFIGERNDAGSGRTFDSDRIQLAVQLNF
ncbi:hypothetical protein J7413_08640 [Shimia sp. R10_1]|uniref:DcaP family trimeric outer membrane transporter n=1 Tax=Shimia sp. R10_1 TaxID=2821095 RepID=UPI001ADB1559|nr:DcaP family trimeric outer membrane transporter [Shimia sp. R10_1]MBO9473603.1 hypothetical protein [Shimia sp. R10_1]